MPSLSRRRVKILRDGVLYRTFPAVQPQFHCTFSRPMLKELEGMAKSDDVCVHVHGDRSMLTYAISEFHKVYKHFPLIVQHLGAGGTRGLRIASFVLPVFNLLERHSFRSIDLFLVQTAQRRKEIIGLGISPEKIRMRGMGVDFDLFKPLDKSECRRRLSLPSDKILVLYVGRFFKDKGLDIVIKAVEKLKRKYDVELVAVGGFRSDPLWPMVEKRLRYYSPRVPNLDMVQYYSAADVFCQFVPHFAAYGGVGVAQQEALACGIPVVCNALVHLAEREVVSRVGAIPETPSDVVKCLEETINNLTGRDKIRKAVRSFISWDGIVAQTLSDYERLYQIYCH